MYCCKYFNSFEMIKKVKYFKIYVYIINYMFIYINISLMIYFFSDLNFIK